MGTVTTLPRSRPLTYDDLAAFPDDGHRYELIDGTLIVSPSPRPLHQRAVLNLAIALQRACPPELEVFVARLDVVLADDTVLEPDVLVARRADLTEQNLPAAPMLAVEVLSPSTRRVDLLLKRSRLAEAGCPAYWVIDPDVPRLIAWELVGGQYDEAADVSCDEAFTATVPFAVTVVPASLV